MTFATLTEALVTARAELRDVQYELARTEAFARRDLVVELGGLKALGTNEAEQKRNIEVALYDNDDVNALRATMAACQMHVETLEAQIDIYNKTVRFAEWDVRERLTRFLTGEQTGIDSIFKQLLDELIDKETLPTAVTTGA